MAKHSERFGRSLYVLGKNFFLAEAAMVVFTAHHSGTNSRWRTQKLQRAVTSFHFIGDNKHTSASASGLSNNGFAFGRCLGGMFAINTSSREPGRITTYWNIQKPSILLYKISLQLPYSS